MANRPIKLKIDVTKILKEHLYKGAKATYLDCVVWPNKNGAGQYGDTHYIVQELSRAARDAGEKGPIIGNATVPENEALPPRQQQARPQQRTAAKQAQQAESYEDGMDEDSIPF